MDCLEFRRQLGSDPHVRDPAAREHLESCAFCADACARAHAFETRLASALAVPVPAGLADRILLAQLTGARNHERSTHRRFAWIALAAAASIALVVGIVRVQSSTTLPALVVAHVTGEERDALNLRAPVPAEKVQQAFSDRAVRLAAAVPGDVAYVNECPIGPYKSVHMVMPENGAPVSVVYVVDHRVKASEDFHRDGFAGREVPIAQGTLVLLAQTADRFDALEHMWRGAIEGSPEVAAGSR
ncbi:MAG: DUF3379 family protein [Dokdonella sp.]